METAFSNQHEDAHKDAHGLRWASTHADACN